MTNHSRPIIKVRQAVTEVVNRITTRDLPWIQCNAPEAKVEEAVQVEVEGEAAEEPLTNPTGVALQCLTGVAAAAQVAVEELVGTIQVLEITAVDITMAGITAPLQMWIQVPQHLLAVRASKLLLHLLLPRRNSK